MCDVDFLPHKTFAKLIVLNIFVLNILKPALFTSARNPLLFDLHFSVCD